MNISHVKIDWYLDWGNSPEIYLTLDNYPNCKFVKKGTKYIGEDYPFYEFYSISDGKGFGGRKIEIIMENDTQVNLKGPYLASRFKGYNVTPISIGLNKKPDNFKGYWGTGYTFGYSIDTNVLCNILLHADSNLKFEKHLLPIGNLSDQQIAIVGTSDSYDESLKLDKICAELIGYNPTHKYGKLVGTSEFNVNLNIVM